MSLAISKIIHEKIDPDYVTPTISLELDRMVCWNPREPMTITDISGKEYVAIPAWVHNNNDKSQWVNASGTPDDATTPITHNDQFNVSFGYYDFWSGKHISATEPYMTDARSGLYNPKSGRPDCPPQPGS